MNIIKLTKKFTILFFFLISCSTNAGDGDNESTAAIPQEGEGINAETDTAKVDLTKVEGTEEKEAEIISNAVIDRLTKFDTDLARDAIGYIKILVQKNRVDQESIYHFVRHIGKSVADINNDDDFIDDVNSVLYTLRKASYSDRIFQNSNLSNQIKARIPLLLEDASRFSKSTTEFQKRTFKDELYVFSDRFLASKRLFLGVGLAYSYIPSANYSGLARIDFSPFQSDIQGGASQVFYRNEFSNKSYGAIKLRARMPVLTVEFSVPQYEETLPLVTEVDRIDIGDPNEDLLVRSNIDTTLSTEFGAELKFSIGEIYGLFLGEILNREFRFRDDILFGVGLTGFEVKDVVRTDFRLRSNPNDAFRDLTTTEIVETRKSNNFNAVFLTLQYNIQLTDELTADVTFKHFGSESNDFGSIEFDGLSTSVGITWFPLF